MKVTILDGGKVDDPTGSAVARSVRRTLDRRGADTSYYLLCREKIRNCAGCFQCWVRSPGQCTASDINRRIAADIANSDLLVYLTPVTFGGYSSELKAMVDHQIQNVAPFFTSIAGETHHQKRYERYPDLIAIGWGAHGKTDAAIFRSLVWRNKLNFHAERAAARVLQSGASAEEVEAVASLCFEDLERESTLGEEPIVQKETHAGTLDRPRRAVLLVGSPRLRNSTSNHLGEYLHEHLRQRGVKTETLFVDQSLRKATSLADLLRAVDDADVVTLAYPLYVDSLPSPTTQVMEHIASHRQETDSRPGQRMLAIANCGFPEAEHNRTSLAICGEFANRSRLEWAGGLALGGGQGAVRGKPLTEAGSHVADLRRALEMTADSLCEGEGVPTAAVDLMARPFIPRWLYRTVGSIGWRMQAQRWGVHRQLRATPYATPRSGSSHETS